MTEVTRWYEVIRRDRKMEMSFFQQQKELVKKEILAKSICLFKEKGYTGISIEQIAKEIGIAKGTFYNYFSNKKDILIIWAEQEFSNISLQSIDYQGSTMHDNLNRFVEVLAEVIKREGNLFISFMEEIILTSPQNELESKFDFPSVFSNIIENSIDSKDLCEHYFEKINVFNNAMFLGLTGWLKQHNSADGLENHLKMIVDICLYGMISNRDPMSKERRK